MAIPTVFPANQKQSFKYVRDRSLFYAHSTQEVLFFFPGVPPVVHADGENHDKASYFTCLTVSRDFLSLEFSGHSQLTSLSSSNWMSFLILGVTSVYHLH